MVLQRVRNKQNDILLHACCGVCAGYPIEKMLTEGVTPLAFFSNDNIDTKEEYQRRVEAFVTVCEHFDIDYVVDEYSPSNYLTRIVGLELEPERGRRCLECISLRLGKSVARAKMLGIKSLTTTLVVSPHKNFKMISQIGSCLAEQEGLVYVAIDFKKQDGFLKTNAISRKLGLYRQNYCGCKFAKGHLREV